MCRPKMQNLMWWLQWLPNIKITLLVITEINHGEEKQMQKSRNNCNYVFKSRCPSQYSVPNVADRINTG